MLLQAGLVLQVLVFGSLYRPIKKEEDENEQPCSQSKTTSCLSSVVGFVKTTWDWSLLKNLGFILYLCSILCTFFVIEVIYKLTPYKSTLDGLTLTQASFLPSSIGLSSTCTRFIVSFVSNMKCVNRIYILAFAMLIQSIGCLSLAFAVDFKHFLGVCVLCGAGIGNDKNIHAFHAFC